MRDTSAERMLAAVEELPPEACGAFVVELDGRHAGSVLVERNQVCWAAATHLRRRLVDLLRESLVEMLSPTELEEMFQRCALEGRRIGEELVSHSLVQGDVMRNAIKQHTIESLIAMPDQLGEEITWVPHRAAGYHPRFTFGPAEVCVGVNAKLYAAEAEGGDIPLEVLEHATPGATFARDDAGDPVPVYTTGDHHSMAALVDLGVWAEAAIGTASGFSSAVLAHQVATASGEITLAWRSSRFLVHAAVLSDKGAIARVLTNLERRGYPAVLSRRAPSAFPTTRNVKEIDHTWQQPKRLFPS